MWQTECISGLLDTDMANKIIIKISRQRPCQHFNKQNKPRQKN